jgi:glycosyltransferase involved in cell wall biosynthesis
LQWMVWADLFAMPSRLEAFGLVYVEAMAAGTPVLMSTDCGLAPQLRLASSEPTVMQHGWGVVPDCAATIENALQEALRDRERLAAMGHAARAFVLPRFTWRENAMQLLAALGGHAPCALEFAEEVACP